MTNGEFCRNLPEMPRDIPSNNAANVIPDAVTDVDGNTYDSLHKMSDGKGRFYMVRCVKGE